SVSIFSIGRGTTDEVNFSNFFIRIYFAIRIEYVYQTINLKSLLPLSVLMSYCWPHAPPNDHNPQWRLISPGQSHILHPPFALNWPLVTKFSVWKDGKETCVRNAHRH